MKLRKYHIVLIGSLLLASCSATKKVPEGDALYMGASVKFDSSGLRSKERKSLRDELSSLTRPRPNKRVLGIPFKLLFNNTKLLRKKGEPPVLMSDVNPEYNQKVLQSTMENRGFFNASVRWDTTVKNKKGRAVYTVRPGPRYTVNAVHFASDTSV